MRRVEQQRLVIAEIDAPPEAAGAAFPRGRREARDQGESRAAPPRLGRHVKVIEEDRVGRARRVVDHVPGDEADEFALKLGDQQRGLRGGA